MRSIDPDLLKSLHEGMFEQPLWSGFLQRLLVRTRASHTALAFRPVGEERLIGLHAGDPPSEQFFSLFAAQGGDDSLPNPEMRPGRVYALDELVDLYDRGQSAARDRLRASWNASQVRSVRIIEPSGIDAWLICAGEDEIGPAVSALMAGLVPHLQIALRAFVALERERFRSKVTSEAFSRLNFGWLTLDAQCRILDMTPHLETLFQRSTILRRGRYDRLTPGSPARDREITALVRQFATQADARPRAINLSRDPLIDMLLRPIRDRSLSASSQPVAIAFISGDRWSQADRCDQLVDLFGLLPSEARLAWAIAQGMSISEAAAELGLSVETARNYSKKIYAKTGARGQAELVRHILTSVLAFA